MRNPNKNHEKTMENNGKRKSGNLEISNIWKSNFPGPLTSAQNVSGRSQLKELSALWFGWGDPKAEWITSWRHFQRSYKAKNWKIDFFTKTVFLTIQVEIGEVWRFPGWPHRSYGHTCKFSADLVLHGIEKSTFQHFPVNWHFKVLEMALKTFHFVPGLSRTPLLFFLDILPT